ncbi:MAG: hypothetical protein DIZ78_05900 [endosymbiont of Escarpia spicata]|uniref:4Fe-4S ferredoxin-type domain-containing protein n=1 Tax=endosymbiont of Escarpia spicata TaxID=2200908 RepID=A0A370DQ09_9GAMM|nr:MAG: hypothetical protein DIZ78_05900 [endosymbiont of Escarpia spicata]
MGSNFRNLISQALLELKQPEVGEGKCVHSLMATASCSSCVDACPRQAWILDDSILGLDTSNCDGCGLCVPVCPEGAIQRLNEPHQCHWKGRDTAFLACERAMVSDVEGIIPCIHSIGIRDLLLLYRKGTKDIMITHGDCARCDRGNVHRLEHAVIRINRMLKDRNASPMRQHVLSSNKWLDNLKTTATANGQEIGRRSFLRRALGMAVTERSTEDKLSANGQAWSVPPGQILPSEKTDSMVPFVPVIDTNLCNGCDACVRLCPHDALMIDMCNVLDAKSYKITAENCSNCGLCIDGCEVGAISINMWTIPDQMRINLVQARCTACGADYHVPKESEKGENTLCRVCGIVNHYRNLYQVMD